MKRILKLEIIISIIIFGILLLFTFYTDTTGDSGDSIVHYLFSHYSFKYPSFFLHHWAKPFFVLCSAPFAQFGFKGIIVFNSICATLSALFSFYIAKNLKIKHSWLVFIFIFFSPMYFKLIFSGLTEYLFALFLVIGIYFISKSKYTYASIIISFLPLIRSEGLLIIGVFGLYYLIQKKYKNIPYLLLGQFIYTIIGAFYYNDILWVINEIPYMNMGSPYGSGELMDFVHRLNYVIEKPIYILLIIGTISLIYSLFRNGLKDNNIKVLLIFSSFFSIFVAHSIFWWLGIFNSMGLPRVLNAVVPLIALISLFGVQQVTSNVQNPIIKYTILFGVSLLICFYPFTERQQGIVFNSRLLVSEENKLIIEEVVPYLKKELPNYSNQAMYFSHPYLSIALNIDHFDQQKHREMKHLLDDDVAKGSIIIWDEWCSVIEGGVSLNQLKNDSRFQLIQTFKRKDNDRTIMYTVFKKTVNN